MILGTPFTDHAVVQRGEPLRVWGWAEPGEEVRVRFGADAASAVAGPDGRFDAELPPPEASAQGRVLAVEGRASVEVRGVVVGEVWLCSGQSNMGWRVEESAPEERAAAAALPPDPLLRHLATPMVGGLEPARRVDAPWEPATPEASPAFQAVPYWFAVQRRRATGLPVGVACATWGASRIQSWLPPGRLEASGHLGFLKEQRLERVERWLLGFQAWERAGAQPPGGWPPAWEVGSQQALSQCRFCLSGPLMPMALAGVLWYQGESDPDLADRYADLFAGLVADWREGFALPGLPVRVVQLPEYAPGGEGWARVREAQEAAGRIPGVEVLCAMGLGTPDDVHPPRKRELAGRLAESVGDPAGASGPRALSAEPDPGRPGAVIVRFDRPLRVAGGGGGARGAGEGGASGGSGGRGVRGFELVDAAGVAHAAAAALVGEDAVRVSADPGVVPAEVRHAWAGAPEVTLTDARGRCAWPSRLRVPSSRGASGASSERSASAPPAG